MPPNPLTDAIVFLTKGDYLAASHARFVSLYWLLLAGALLAALLVWWREPAQRSGGALGILCLRVLTGTMWWQQSLWKIPPHYAGLVYWMKQEAAHAAVPLQGALVRNFVLPHIAGFGPLVYAFEVAIGVSLILGLFTRLGAFMGILMAVNLWLGLYSAPGEWPWTYFFLVIIMMLFFIDPPGRVLGFDGLWHRAGARGASLLA